MKTITTPEPLASNPYDNVATANLGVLSIPALNDSGDGVGGCILYFDNKKGLFKYWHPGLKQTIEPSLNFNFAEPILHLLGDELTVASHSTHGVVVDYPETLEQGNLAFTQLIKAPFDNVVQNYFGWYLGQCTNLLDYSRTLSQWVGYGTTSVMPTSDPFNQPNAISVTSGQGGVQSTITTTTGAPIVSFWVYIDKAVNFRVYVNATTYKDINVKPAYNGVYQWVPVSVGFTSVEFNTIKIGTFESSAYTWGLYAPVVSIDSGHFPPSIPGKLDTIGRSDYSAYIEFMDNGKTTFPSGDRKYNYTFDIIPDLLNLNSDIPTMIYNDRSYTKIYIYQYKLIWVNGSNSVELDLAQLKNTHLNHKVMFHSSSGSSNGYSLAIKDCVGEFYYSQESSLSLPPDIPVDNTSQALGNGCGFYLRNFAVDLSVQMIQGLSGLPIDYIDVNHLNYKVGL